jgi:hypothetical protein
MCFAAVRAAAADDANIAMDGTAHVAANTSDAVPNASVFIAVTHDIAVLSAAAAAAAVTAAAAATCRSAAAVLLQSVPHAHIFLGQHGRCYG